MKPGPKPNPYSAQESDYATTYQQEYIRCGKPNCHTCSDGPGHGPYWYAYHYSPQLRRRTKKYIGKHLPEHLHTAAPLPLMAEPTGEGSEQDH